MELVSENYIKINKYDLFNQLIISYDKYGGERLTFFQKLLKVVTEFEKNNSTHISDIYISRNDFLLPDVTVSRKTILNAYVHSCLNNDIISLKIKDLLSSPVLFLDDFKDKNLLNYILNNSIEIDEYYDGEKIKLIYKDDVNILEYGFIFKNNTKILRKN